MALTRAVKKLRRARDHWGEPSILTENKCDDPRFVTGTKWTFGVGWSNTTPTATTTGGAIGLLEYDAAGLVTVGKQYVLTISVAGTYGGSNEQLYANMGGITTLPLTAKQGNISCTGTWEAVDSILVIKVQATDDFIGTVTNVTLREVI